MSGPPQEPCVANRGIGMPPAAAIDESIPVSSTLVFFNPRKTSSPRLIYCAEKWSIEVENGTKVFDSWII